MAERKADVDGEKGHGDLSHVCSRKDSAEAPCNASLSPTTAPLRRRPTLVDGLDFVLISALLEVLALGKTPFLPVVPVLSVTHLADMALSLAPFQYISFHVGGPKQGFKHMFEATHGFFLLLNVRPQQATSLLCFPRGKTKVGIWADVLRDEEERVGCLEEAGGIAR